MEPKRQARKMSRRTPTTYSSSAAAPRASPWPCACPPASSVGLVAKGPLSEGSTLYAQGGISAVLDKADSIESHIEDTLNAGAGLSTPATVRYVVERARPASAGSSTKA